MSRSASSLGPSPEDDEAMDTFDQDLFQSPNFEGEHLDPDVLGFRPDPFLRVIVLACPGRLDQRYADVKAAGDFIAAHRPAFASMLKEAYDTKSTIKIREYAPLRAVAVSPVAEEHAGQYGATRDAWTTPYIGDYHEILNTVLTDKAKGRERGDACANYVAIIQSSGTGKSRMVHEHARICFTIPVNIRGPASDASGAWPPSDHPVYRHLVLCTPLDYLAMVRYYIAFFVCVFERVQGELVNNKATLSKRDYKEVAEAWREHLETDGGAHRETMYADACAEAEKLVASWESQKKSPRQLANKTQISAIEPHVVNRANRALESLRAEIDALVEDKKSKPYLELMNYFDEAHTLTGDPQEKAEPGKPHPRSRFAAFTAAWDHFRNHPVLTLFMSTNSRLARLSPPGDMHDSGRVHKNDKLQAPITMTPFDCFPERPLVRSGLATLDEVSNIGFMAQFGRPVWMSRIHGASALAPVVAELVTFAQSKLLKIQRADEATLKTLSSNAVLAVLGTRLLLGFEPRRQKTRQVENELVASHMRLAYSVHKSREYMRSGYSSEPILAEAAARTCFQLKQLENGGKSIDTLLYEHVDHSLFEKGPRGELVGRLLLITAFDQAREKEYAATVPPNKSLCPPLYGVAVSLINFIEALFGTVNAKIIRKSRPDNIPDGKTFEEAFKHAKVRFTHFAKAGDGTAVSTAGCYAAAIRGMAWQCRGNQGTIDCLVPIILRDGPLGEEIMSGLFIQLRDKVDETSVVNTVIDAEKLNFFPVPSDAQEDVRPYITLSMDLGVQPRIPREFTFPEDVKLDDAPTTAVPDIFRNIPATPAKLEVNQPPDRTSDRQRASASPAHPRYAIRAIGCSPAVYGVVQNKDMYANLLGSRDFLRDHPHANARSLSAVRRMKPVWTMGDECYDWVDHAHLRGEGPKVLDSEPEGVTVGVAAITGVAASASATRGDCSDVEMENADAGANPFI